MRGTIVAKNITTDSMTGMRVLGGKKGTKRIGKVRRFVFHPRSKRVVGFIVKRPDLLWMFHRKDLFVSIDGYDMVDGRIVVRDVPEATNKGACKALGVDWDDCVLWVGLPVMTEDGTSFGVVGDVTFDRVTGAVRSFETSSGMTANAVLGTRTISADMIKGFRTGMGAALTDASSVGAGEGEGEVVLGAILVSDEVKGMGTEGGIAEKAGQATAVAVDKVQNSVKPAASAAVAATGEAVNKGAYATGRQIAKSKTMFSDFKAEYDKARGPKPDPAKKAASKASAATSTAKKAGAKKPVKKPAKGKNMFAAFKDEYNKARHDD